MITYDIFNQKKMLKTELCFKNVFQKKGEFVKIKTSERNKYFLLVCYFSGKKNVENLVDSCIAC